MKQVKNIAAAILAVVLISTAAFANNPNPGTKDTPLKVKYLGDEGNYLYFQVTVVPSKDNMSFLRINDTKDGELYTENLKNNGYVKTYKIEKKDGQELNFSLIYGKKVYSKSFTTDTKINETTTVNENDVVII